MRAIRLLGAGALFLVAGCNTPRAATREIERIFTAQRGASTSLDEAPDFDKSAREEAQRRERIRALLDAGEVKTGQELYQAAFVLSTSSDREELELARDLAFAAADRGVDEALPVAAEAIDKGLFVRGLPQRYCTQYVYVPVLDRWELYDWDAAVTDEERLQMGVKTLEQALARLEILNAPREAGADRDGP